MTDLGTKGHSSTAMSIDEALGERARRGAAHSHARQLRDHYERVELQSPVTRPDTSAAKITAAVRAVVRGTGKREQK